jgi:hypothetical protein
VAGLGHRLIDLFKTSLPRSRVIAVYFTYGDRRNEAKGNVVTLGKAFLVTNLQTLLQTGRLHLPRSQAERLAKELLDFEIRVEENANERYGAFQVGSQDDLVTALGLAVQPEPVNLGIVVPRSRRQPGKAILAGPSPACLLSSPNCYFLVCSPEGARSATRRRAQAPIYFALRPTPIFQIFIFRC